MLALNSFMINLPSAGIRAHVPTPDMSLDSFFFLEVLGFQLDFSKYFQQAQHSTNGLSHASRPFGFGYFGGRASFFAQPSLYYNPPILNFLLLWGDGCMPWCPAIG
jgi:hypothetical protein